MLQFSGEFFVMEFPSATVKSKENLVKKKKKNQQRSILQPLPLQSVLDVLDTGCQTIAL